MDYIVQFQINIYAIMVLIVLYLIIKLKSRVETFGKRLLKLVLIGTAVAIIVEPLTWIFDRKTFYGAFLLEYGTNFLLFMLGPVLAGLMLAYVDYHLFTAPKRIYRRFFYQHISLLTFIILLINLFYPIYFSVEPVHNIFHSEMWKPLHYLLLASVYLYMALFVWRHRRRTRPYVINIFFIFFILPILGMVVQLFDSKLYFSWTSIVLGILAAYIFLETISAEEDNLTKVYNRHSYELYVRYLMEDRKPFGVILFDLDRFKGINDRFGHDTGDQVLVAFAQVLQKVFAANALVSRMGGDEFVVVLRTEEENIDNYIEEVQALLRKSEMNHVNGLTFSYGYQRYSEAITADEMYTLVDKKMYAFKNRSDII
ncbi:GGDEF domain-containing protein [Gracilibacillus timonensis]|uniref:GGDEF domain-containing protein n=1 Tax=Gracilibacillus timonensis TaxID=1816696 RepID=UPI0008246D28|nr:GGDEF domain-containing protein [Gracilibacillus timonensis]